MSFVAPSSYSSSAGGVKGVVKLLSASLCRLNNLHAPAHLCRGFCNQFRRCCLGRDGFFGLRSDCSMFYLRLLLSCCASVEGGIRRFSQRTALLHNLL